MWPPNDMKYVICFFLKLKTINELNHKPKYGHVCYLMFDLEKHLHIYDSNANVEPPVI